MAAPAGTRRDRAVRLAVYATDLTATLNGDGHDRDTDSDHLPPYLAALCFSRTLPAAVIIFVTFNVPIETLSVTRRNDKLPCMDAESPPADSTASTAPAPPAMNAADATPPPSVPAGRSSGDAAVAAVLASLQETLSATQSVDHAMQAAETAVTDAVSGMSNSES